MLLKNGEVMGCIGTQATAVQGCTVRELGCMPYRVFASPDFAAHWFGGAGLTLKACCRAPFLLFNRKDEVHHPLFSQVLGHIPSPRPSHYLLSSEKFAEVIAAGMGYGMLPDQQSQSLVQQGRIIDLAPGILVPVRLYWHCWNIASSALCKLSEYLVSETKSRLPAGNDSSMHKT